MDKPAIRPLVFDVLRRTPQTHLHAIENEVRQKAEGYERGDSLLVQEVVWELLVQGMLAPGKNSLNLHLPFVHVTEYGQRCFDEGGIAAHDPDGYAARLRTETNGMISRVVLETTRDALLAFHRGLFRASLILLSHAARELLREVQGNESGRALLSIPDAPALAELGVVARLACTEDGGLALPTADRETVLGRLLLFPSQCRIAYTLREERRRSREEVGA